MSIIMAITGKCQAQDISYDSLTKRILRLETDQRYIKINLDKSHEQFKTGTFTLLAGVVTTAAGIILYQKQDDSIDLISNNKNSRIIMIGSGLLTIGAVIQIDSHKYIGRAGRRRK